MKIDLAYFICFQRVVRISLRRLAVQKASLRGRWNHALLSLHWFHGIAFSERARIDMLMQEDEGRLGWRDGRCTSPTPLSSWRTLDRCIFWSTSFRRLHVRGVYRTSSHPPVCVRCGPFGSDRGVPCEYFLFGCIWMDGGVVWAAKQGATAVDVRHIHRRWCRPPSITANKRSTKKMCGRSSMPTSWVRHDARKDAVENAGERCEGWRWNEARARVWISKPDHTTVERGEPNDATNETCCGRTRR